VCSRKQRSNTLITHKKNTNGCLFSIDIMDFKGVEIQCTFFNEAADKFYDQLIEGVVYEFGNG